MAVHAEHGPDWGHRSCRDLCVWVWWLTFLLWHWILVPRLWSALSPPSGSFIATLVIIPVGLSQLPEAGCPSTQFAPFRSGCPLCPWQCLGILSAAWLPARTLLFGPSMDLWLMFLFPVRSLLPTPSFPACLVLLDPRYVWKYWEASQNPLLWKAEDGGRGKKKGILNYLHKDANPSHSGTPC